MRLTRRRLLASAAAAGLGGAGIYELVDRLAGTSPQRTTAAELPVEQHVLDLRVVTHEHVEVVVPPLHHEVVTAKLHVGDVRQAQRSLEHVLQEVDARYDPTTPAGLGVTVAWGVPYFRAYVARQAERHLPLDRRADKAALLPTRTFPSDPDDTVLEENDVAFLLRSDVRAHIADAHRRIFALPFLRVTSIRRGFAGGGFDGATSLPKQMAMAAAVPGADLIPDTAELFLGFTSTQKAGLGPRRIANHETLGFVDVRDSGYFRGGTHMHLSHIAEDLEAWYLNFDFQERVTTTFRPGLASVREGAQTVRESAEDALSEQKLRKETRAFGRFGHSGSIQPTSRLQHDFVADDGTVYPKGTAIPQRADFNTLDNPFAWTADERRDKFKAAPAAGVHFVVFNPSSDDFNRTRLAMDGVLPGGQRLPVQPTSRGAGFNAVLQTTHRQNFLVPPRRHRSFPLAEL